MSKPSRTEVLQLAAKAGVDPRTAAKALRDGPDAVRGITGERIAEAIRELNLDTRASH